MKKAHPIIAVLDLDVVAQYSSFCSSMLSGPHILHQLILLDTDAMVEETLHHLEEIKEILIFHGPEFWLFPEEQLYYA